MATIATPLVMATPSDSVEREHGGDDVDVAAARAGDVDAFERLYRRHHPRIDRTVRWLLATDDVADVVQDAFVRAWSKLGLYDGRAAFGTWLYRLAVNVALRGRARRVRWTNRHDDGADVDESVASAVTVDVRLDLDRAIASLPSGAREVFVLVEVEGYTHAEVGQALSISAHTSRSQLHRARMLLRQSMRRSDGA